MAVSADVARLAAAAPEYAEAMNAFQHRNFVFLMIDGATFAIGRYLPQLIGAHSVRGRARRQPLLPNAWVSSPLRAQLN